MFDILLSMVGPILFFVVSAIFFICGKAIGKKRNDEYNNCPIGKAIVIGPTTGEDQVWLCKLVDKDGYESMCLSDLRLHVDVDGVASPQKGDVEEVYLQPCSSNQKKYIDGHRIIYDAHFCNQQYYGLQRQEYRLKRMVFYVLSATCGIIAIVQIAVNVVNVMSGAI